MRNLNIKSTFASSFLDKNAEGQSEQTSSTEVAEMFSYPTVWKKAFSLGQNVRFTRTPEVEILRRRIETDPVFAQQFQALSAKEKKKLTHVPTFDKESIKSQLIENEEALYCSTALEPVSQQTVGELIEKDTEKNLSSVENVKQKIEPVFYLSDNAFFECEPFMIEQVRVKNSQKEKTCCDLAEETVFQKSDDLLDICSAFDESITTLYRVLEGGSAQLYHSTASEVLEENIKKISDANSLKSEKSEGVLAHNAHSIFEKIETNQESSILKKSAQETRDFSNCVVSDDCRTVDVAKSAADLFVKKTKKYSQQAVDMPLYNNHSDFMLRTQFAEDHVYNFPSIDLLQEPISHSDTSISQETLERSAGLLESVLEDFGIKGEIIHVHPGPVVTMYEFEPAAGVKSSRVIGLSDDIARSMSAISARVAVIPGRNVIGIELPNAARETVYLRELIQSSSFCDSQFKLALALGKGINGEPVIAELAKMPHLLVAGTTGSGKSVAINTMILSILYRMTPEQCRLIMVDPKMLELSIYDGIPHLLTPVVTDSKKAVTALKWAVREMEERYRKMAKLGVRNIDGFNARVALAAEKGETIMCTVQSGFDKETGEMLYHEEAMDLTQLPYIVVIVDEMADLMMVAGKEIESAIQRLAQMARAAGIHLIMATQRPSVDVITGTIKANFPTRISFQVTSKIDSRTILGEQGAETLLGQGDMLHMIGGGRIMRVHGPFVSDKEVESVVEHLKMQGKPDYLAKVTDSEDDEKNNQEADDSVSEFVAAGKSGGESEELYAQAVKIVMRDKKCSTSYIQRRLSIGYNKAASLVEKMEEEGIVGAANHVGKREILLSGCGE
ncbi:DNA translocase FtsK [Bartonella sp. F02]|uniref:DNA translocase FtsK n=1 Tax=Bartonella sp. F02 TaxID=2967262 RepID=UPI0022A8D3B1|nr:DNA translocase FtsK [Bartonella sp. F02]MCZ2328906.1 FtsK/SpoIIIE domain-containing protein [Bartonella sp. F02]